jgi:soluble lytic murein transglycosylase-like protein
MQTTSDSTQTSPSCTPAPNLNDICSGGCKKSWQPSILAPYNDFTTKYATSNVSKKLIESIIYHESTGNPKAISSAGACGLMQIMPQGGSCTNDPRGNLFDPETNIKIGTQLFAQKLAAISKFNYPSVTDIEMAAAAYNCCANGSNPNDLSADCKANNIPAWACPINPGADKNSNMCTVKNYACSVAACGT